ncbi:Protein of unknown function [Sphingobacterium nematocida]|uniref:DUF1573 domain-containing protein n=1 Tax=Sphingobacterium nematocida TaxID=1513896 RepID=A0A1T5CW24_9SPHI|nr:DUF1573 domain-containing protein [Sphingobacterium nematocida]SKB63738.1 Protein of unknown function [Sphingobacterium nematocida]
MKFRNTLLAFSILGFMASCGNQGDTNVNKGTTAIAASVTDSTHSEQGSIEFENAVFDFGKVKEGAVVEHVFKFTNGGTAPVILSQVSASCGCTTPDFTKEPILPGKTGEIKVSFNSLGQVGTQQKIVTVSSNAEPRVTTVQIKGVVEK